MADFLDNWTEWADQDASAADKRGVKVNFGQLTIKPFRFTHWQDDGSGNRTPIEVKPEQYGNLPTGSRSMDLEFSINVKEFNPSWENPYERRCRIGSKDWYATIRPSIEAILGKGSMAEGKYSGTLADLNGKYVETNDVPQKEKDGTDSTEWNMIKLITVFSSRSECFAAWQERFGGNGEEAPTASGLDMPDIYDEASWRGALVDIKKALNTGQTVQEVAKDYSASNRQVLQALTGEIKKELDAGVTGVALAQRYDVHVSDIMAIKSA